MSAVTLPIAVALQLRYANRGPHSDANPVTKRKYVCWGWITLLTRSGLWIGRQLILIFACTLLRDHGVDPRLVRVKQRSIEG